MAILHVINYDNHLKTKDDSFLHEPENGLERLLSELHSHTVHQVKNIYLHINNLNHLNQSLSIEYKVEDKVYKIWYETIQFDDENQATDFFSKITKKFGIHTILFHYLRLDWVCINKFLPPNINNYAVLHDTWLFSESGGVFEDYKRNIEVSDFLKRTTGIIVVSQFMYNCVNLLYPEYKNKVEMIENDISTIPYIFTPKQLIDKKLDVLILGNITIPIKGSDVIDSLFNISKNQRYHVLGRVSEELRNKPFYSIKTYNQNTLVDCVREINPHVILIPSIWAETFGLTALEATYLGYPVVCFDVGDLKRIEERHLGYVVTEKNAFALLSMLDNIKLDIEDGGKEYKSICKSIKEYPKKFELDKKYLRLYHEKDLNCDDVLMTYDDVVEEQNTQYLLNQNNQKVNYSIYKTEKKELENVVNSLQKEIQTYLQQIKDYNQLYLNEKKRAEMLEKQYLSLLENKQKKLIKRIFRKIKKM